MKIKPMLAETALMPFDLEGWQFEPKFDGFRAIAQTGMESDLYSRSGVSFKTQFTPIFEALAPLPWKAVLDGEIVATDSSGKHHFEWLGYYPKQKQGHLIYWAFDIIRFGNLDLTPLPYFQRRQALEKILPFHDLIKLCPVRSTFGITYFEEMTKKGFEGIVAKDTNSPYEEGCRSPYWIKIPRLMTMDTVIGGYTRARGGNEDLGALLVGVETPQGLRFSGHVGTGFSEITKKELHRHLLTLKQPESPFHQSITPNTQATWVKPLLVAEVAYKEMTEHYRLRQPRFVRLRPDKKPQDTLVSQRPLIPSSIAQTDKRIRLKLEGKHVGITHPKKVWFPEEKITKEDIVDYYFSIKDIILPYLRDRPQVLYRQPHGISEIGFYQKNMVEKPEWITTYPVKSETQNKTIHYVICNDLPTLIWLVNLGVIGMHPMNSRIPTLHTPDYMVMDIDAKEASLAQAVEAALVFHSVCEDFSLPHGVKISGKSGFHIFLPLQPGYTHLMARRFCHLLAGLTNQKLPESTSLERNPEKRRGKVYLDYGQNAYGQTIASAYGVRPVFGAPVSTPLYWDELTASITPLDFTVKTVAERLEAMGDPWRNLFDNPINLKMLIKSIKGKLRSLPSSSA